MRIVTKNILLFSLCMACITFITACRPERQVIPVPDFYPPSLERQTVEVFDETSAGGAQVTSLRVKAADNSGNVSVMAYYRAYGAAEFTVLPMSHLGENIYVATLPPGINSIEYYFSASDGTNLTLSPATAPASFYSRLVGVPVIDGDKYFGTFSSVIRPLTEDQTVEVDITSDTPLAADSPRVEWRLSGASTWNIHSTVSATSILPGGAVYYRFVIPRTNFTNDGATYEFRVVATNTAGANHGACTAYWPSSTTTKTFTVSSTINRPPVAVLRYDSSRTYFKTTDFSGNSDIILDGTGSYDPEDGSSGLVAIWSQVEGPKVTLKESGLLAQFTPTAVGTYSFKLVVKDKNGNSSNPATTSPPIRVSIPELPSAAIPNNLTQEIILTRASSPYLVTEPYIIENGGKLKIERGVTLNFKAGGAIIVKPGGILNAEGDSTNMITFQSALESPTKGQWGGLKFISLARYPECTLAYCVIKHARTAITMKSSASPTISNCIITDNYDGILCTDMNETARTIPGTTGSSTTISKCQIMNNGTDGIILLNNSTATISNNRISGNKSRGICAVNSKAEIAKNIIESNNYGIYAIYCRRTDGNILNIFANRIGKNTDGIRLDAVISTASPWVNDANIGTGPGQIPPYGADATIKANDIYENNDNGIIAKNCTPKIVSNGIRSNRDDGIHLESCFNADYWMNTVGTVSPLSRKPDNVWPVGYYPFTGGLDEQQIYNNLIGFSGGEGIELTDSSPIINHNNVLFSYDNGILCLDGSSPFIKNTVIGGNGRAGVAIDSTSSRPIVRYNAFYMNSYMTSNLSSLGLNNMDPSTGTWNTPLVYQSEGTVKNTAPAASPVPFSVTASLGAGFNISAPFFIGSQAIPAQSDFTDWYNKPWKLQDWQPSGAPFQSGGWNQTRYTGTTSRELRSHLINSGEPLYNFTTQTPVTTEKYYGLASSVTGSDATDEFQNDDIGVIEINDSLKAVED